MTCGAVRGVGVSNAATIESLVVAAITRDFGVRG
jgi:hypothetical protein